MNNHKHNNFPKKLTRLFSVTIATAAVALTTGCAKQGNNVYYNNTKYQATPASTVSYPTIIKFSLVERDIKYPATATLFTGYAPDVYSVNFQLTKKHINQKCQLFHLTTTLQLSSFRKIKFTSKTASFDQEAINQVPEPLTCFGGILGLGAMVAARKRSSSTLD